MDCIQPVLSFILVLLMISGVQGVQGTGAEQTQNTCMVLVTSTSGGSVQPDGAVSVPYGSSLTITSTPLPGYAVSQVLIEDTEHAPATLISLDPVTRDMIVHVEFAKESPGTTYQSSPPCILPQASTPTISAAHTPQSRTGNRTITVGQRRDFTRIQDAIDQAPDGYSINIDPGVYQERLMISRPVLLIGAQGGKERPVITGLVNDTTITVLANDCVLQNLVIVGSQLAGDQDTAIVARNTTGLVIDRCTITDASNGFVLDSGDRARIISTSIRDIAGTGITAIDHTGLRMERTSVSQCQVGIRVINLSASEFTSNLISGNRESGLSVDAGCSELSISDNLFVEDPIMGTGEVAREKKALLLEKADAIMVSSNQFLNNTGTALFIHDARRANISQNLFQGNYAAFTATGNIIEPQNRIDDTNLIEGKPLLYYEGASGLHLDGIQPATLYLLNCSDSSISNITITTPNEFGLVVKGGRNISVSSSQVAYSRQQNILVAGVQGISIKNTDIHHSTGYAIGLIDTVQGIIAENGIRMNGAGIAVRGTVHNLSITKNALSENDQGVIIRDKTSSSPFGEITENLICASRVALSLYGTSGTIKANQINNSQEGIHLTGTCDLLIENNQINATGTALLMHGDQEGIQNTEGGGKNIITRNTFSAQTPILFNGVPGTESGSSFILNDFISITGQETSSRHAAAFTETPASWGGVSLLSSAGNLPVRPQSLTGGTTWNTSERIRYTYGNLTFSGVLGNHWSLYAGEEIGASGVGSTPYEISTGNIDYAPLIRSRIWYNTGGRGGDGYPLVLHQGWNLVSTPSVLTDRENTAKVFESVDTAGHSMYTYQNGTWIRLHADDEILPLAGYWIYANKLTSVPLFFDPGIIPKPAHLVEGWNLIGHPGIQPGSARDTLSSLDTAWSYLVGYDATVQQYEKSIEQNNASPLMYPAKGYWIYLNQEWNLQPVTG